MKHASFLRFLGTAAAFAGASSCSWFQQQQLPEEKKEEKEPPPLYLGTVDQVYPDRQFALIRLIAPMPAPGTTLISHPADGSTARVGNLSASSERVDDLRVAADIRGGTVMRGDYVFAYRPLAEPIAKKQDVPGETSPGNGEDDDTPLPETGGPLPENTGVLTLPEAPLPGLPERDIPELQSPSAAPPAPVPSPAGPRAPRKAPSSLDDIPDRLEDL